MHEDRLHCPCQQLDRDSRKGQIEDWEGTWGDMVMYCKDLPGQLKSVMLETLWTVTILAKSGVSWLQDRDICRFHIKGHKLYVIL